MIARISLLFLLPALFLPCGSALAQQAVRSGTYATIHCDGQLYVPVTADEEQGIPLEVVDKAACGSRVTVLSDPQGYTVRVRTAAGKAGYVARYQIAMDAESKPTAAPARDVNGAAKEPVARPSGDSAAQQSGPQKPRVYVSDTASWNASGAFGNASSVAPGALYGGYNPDLVDIYQDFTSGCSTIAVTQKKSDADFVVLFDKGTPKKGVMGLHGLVKENKVTVLSKTGETLVSEADHSPDAAVAAACNAVSQPAHQSNVDGTRKSSDQLR
ncbi:MAG TPA: hypothetical protein VFW94_19300 [Candidatus Acidoferrales bacterium]|nr:hypothetical protein [Candidatus Acidoferrales bacterium]